MCVIAADRMSACRAVSDRQRTPGFASHPYGKQRMPRFTSHPYVNKKPAHRTGFHSISRNAKHDRRLFIRFAYAQNPPQDRSGSLHFAGSQATGANVKPFGAAIHFAFNAFYVGFPHCICPSMRMAYIVTKLNALTANITFSHLDTSSTYKCTLLIQV